VSDATALSLRHSGRTITVTLTLPRFPFKRPGMPAPAPKERPFGLNEAILDSCRHIF